MSSAEAWAFRVHHIREAIEKIQRYTAGMDPAGLAADEKTLDAVLRNFQVIGEAARKLPAAVKRKHRHLPWHEMESMRHILVHDYDRVDLSILWQTIVGDLPPLLPELERMLRETGS